MNLNGVLPVMLTPFNADESIDEESLRKEVDFAIEGGAVGICAPGFASEFYKLSDPERYRMAKVVVEHTRGRLPVVVSTGSGSVHSTVEFSRYAESIGAQCLMVVAPRVAPLGVKELTFFYEAVCRGVKIPVMLQDADFTGSGLPAKLFVDLAERCPNFQFAKLEITLPGSKCAEIIRLSRGKLRVLYGLGGIAMVDGFEHGACGIMPGAAFVDLYAHIIQLFTSGRVNEAKSLFYRLEPYLIFALQHLELAIGIEKRALVRRGILPSDHLREPTIHLDEEYQKQMDDLIDMVIGLTREVPKPLTARA